MKNIITYIVIIVLILGGIYAANVLKSAQVPSEKLTSFAQCIAVKKITMYGAAWCSHCQREKALFGSAFQYVPYVECPENQKLCTDKGIEGYPTWIDSVGIKHAGEQGLDGLAKISGCTL